LRERTKTSRNVEISFSQSPERATATRVLVQLVIYVNIETTTDYIDRRLTNDRPDLSSERVPQIRQDCNFKKTSGQKSQIGLDTKTY
jgi:hypothetical protein